MLLARQPSAPRRRTARAVPLRAVENAVGADDLPIRREADCADTAARTVELRVRHIDPTVLGCPERRAAVGLPVPRVGAVLDRAPREADEPRGESGRKTDAVRI